MKECLSYLERAIEDLSTLKKEWTDIRDFLPDENINELYSARVEELDELLGVLESDICDAYRMLNYSKNGEDEILSTRKDTGAPNRYVGKGIHKIETIEAMEYCAKKFDSTQAVSVAEIVRYLSRYNDKHGYRDLDAACDYIKRLMGDWK